MWFISYAVYFYDFSLFMPFYWAKLEINKKGLNNIMMCVCVCVYF